jgi:hypothetical protein
MPHAMITTTTVLIAVAKFESTPSIPTFANIEVNAAKIADNTAKRNHITHTSFLCCFKHLFIIAFFPINEKPKIKQRAVRKASELLLKRYVLKSP